MSEVGQSERKRRCYQCMFYKVFYTKGYVHFDKTDMGRCNRKQIVVDKHETCEGFIQRPTKRYQRDAALRALQDVLVILREVGQILSEEQEDKR